MPRQLLGGARLLILSLIASIALAQPPQLLTPPFSEAPKPAKIALVIDDVGHHLRHQEFLDLAIPITLAILPGSPHATKLATTAHQAGHQVMLHLPMQAQGQQTATEAGMLSASDSLAHIELLLDYALQQVPHAQGVNNHQGSYLTEQKQSMAWLMQALKQRQLYFLDSRTSAATVAEQQALAHGVPTIRRHVFLDNQLQQVALEQAWQGLLELAQKQSQAVVIAHPHPETLAFLKEKIPLLPTESFQFVYVSELLN